uniref:Uncharacterized protein n=1 Tax=Hucho hucho TaxID=62062 RepID=A0A4W5K6V0_9TELE
MEGCYYTEPRLSSSTEIALQQVSMSFRSDPKWEVVEPLKDIGWRIRKKYFLIKSKDQPKERQVLSWVSLLLRSTVAVYCCCLLVV